MAVKPGYKQTEVGVIPEEWDAARLGDLGKFKNGINKSSEAFGHGSPFVNLMDVFGVSSIASSDALGLVDTNNTEQQTYDLRKGDVIFIRSSVKPSGVGLTAVVEEDLPKTVYSGFLIRFRDGGALGNGFKRHCFYEDGFRKRMLGASSVSANTNINQDNLKRLLLSLPPTKAEQEAIAGALSDANALIGALNRLIAKKRDLKQAAMQQLLTGQKRLPGFEVRPGYKQTEVGVIPEDWDISTFSGLFDVTAGGDVDPKRSASHQDETHCYPIYSNALTNRGLYGYCSYANHQVGSITITARGTLGCANFRDHPYTAIGRVLVLQPKNEIAGGFFAEVINNRVKFAVESTGVPQLTAPQISTYRLPVPPLPEQTAIAEVLSDMDAELAALTQRRDKTRALKQGMMQELLTGRTRLV